MFVKNNTTGKYYIDGVEVSPEEYETRLADFWANYVPEPIPEPELTEIEQKALAYDILMGVSE